MMQIQQNYVG